MTVHYSFDFAQQVCLYMQVVHIKLYHLGPLPKQPAAARTYIFNTDCLEFVVRVFQDRSVYFFVQCSEYNL